MRYVFIEHLANRVFKLSTKSEGFEASIVSIRISKLEKELPLMKYLNLKLRLQAGTSTGNFYRECENKLIVGLIRQFSM